MGGFGSISDPKEQYFRYGDAFVCQLQKSNYFEGETVTVNTGFNVPQDCPPVHFYV